MSFRTRALPIVVLAALAATVLSGCGGGSGEPTPSPTASRSATATPTPTPTPEPVPTETTAPAVTLPTDCNSLGTEAVRQEAVGDMTLQSDGVGFVRPAPANAQLALGCSWIVGDTTGMLLLISTAAPDDVTAALATLPGLGYSCAAADDFGAEYCQLPGASADSEDVVVARDGVWIYLETANRSGRAFLSDIATQIWG